MSRREAIGAAADQMARSLIDEGRLIEAGCVAFLAQSYPDGVIDEQGKQLRMAFFAGAQHLMGSIMGALDPGAEPTEQDMRRMELIAEELNAWIHQFKASHGITDPDIGPVEGTEH